MLSCAGRLVVSSYRALFILTLCGLVSSAASQLVNGQFFTSGLAISNAPAPGSQLSAGGAIGVSVDVSGNGRLPTSASIPGSTLPTAFISLNIFLISSQTNTNVTVTSGPQFFAGEQGSTVKHLNFAIPSCLKSGDYNYTYYEVSRINEQTYFSITPIPIFILNNQSPSDDDTCGGSTAPEAQPQPSSPPPEQPFLGSGFSLTTGFSQPAAPTNTGTGTQDTVTVTLTRTVISTISTIVTATQTLSLSGGGFTTVTMAVPTLLPTTVTSVFTTASTSGSFIPINAGCRLSGTPILLASITASMLITFMWEIL
ncbi:hypothetical protein BDV93DRAFT_137060 [Ceratobasidium sp. AG-I]|nr:hypothetical protein BDV93DRAFT_137060 [Ceratobasidium sp. AG-I]